MRSDLTYHKCAYSGERFEETVYTTVLGRIPDK